MKFILYIILVCSPTCLFSQVGIGTLTPDDHAVLEIESTDKGLLTPRVPVNDLSNKAPISVTPKDGLIVFNNSATIRKSLVYWNAQTNSGNGAWDKQLFFKETPKTAVIGLSGNNMSVLNNADAGDDEIIGSVNTNYTILNSGNMDQLSVSLDEANLNVINVGTGIYTLEASLLISAPAPDSGRGESIGGGLYNMGYYMDFYVPYTTEGGTSGYILNRVERSVVSPLNNTHRVTFITSLERGDEITSFDIYTYLGRRLGSTHRDRVTIISDGSYYKLTKLK
ncbi:hypothetical protein ACFFU1_17440 [Algibacter miyuki]|uniref:Uncharacterized protein n=1 Tax=Algibacter miyuki TaxID=1306933 RepID=A0ABV5H4K6_9FLAO|nr:hypothetical protein [Algibacter miyuki]MDN3664541.1 hypothetical protein [Algibacter miyuki]